MVTLTLTQLIELRQKLAAQKKIIARYFLGQKLRREGE